MADGLRRYDVHRMTTAEAVLFNAALVVERVGADPRLTRAVELVTEARFLVADVVDQVDQVQVQVHEEPNLAAALSACPRDPRTGFPLPLNAAGERLAPRAETEQERIYAGRAPGERQLWQADEAGVARPLPSARELEQPPELGPVPCDCQRCRNLRAGLRRELVTDDGVRLVDGQAVPRGARLVDAAEEWLEPDLGAFASPAPGALPQLDG